MGIGGFWQDIKLGVRGLRRQRGFAAAAILTLALGIGATTAVFSVVRHVLLAPLPYRDADRLVMIWSRWRGFDKTWLSDAEAADYRAQIQAFEDAGTWSGLQVNLTGDGEPLRVGAAAVTPNLFGVLGTPPLMGRPFTEAEATVSPATVTILGYGLWHDYFGADPAILGRTIQINGRAVEVVGVMPREFQLPTDYVVDAEEPTRLWLPLQLNPQNRGSHGYHGAARLRDGATVAQANAQLAALTTRWTSEGLYPVPMQFSAYTVMVGDEALGTIRPALWLVFGAVCCLLLIACANVANLLLVRSDARTREFAVRAALGADRARLIRQLLTESAVVAGAAAVLGVALAVAVVSLLRHLAGVPRAAAIAIDPSVLTFSVGLTLATLVLFSVLPAVRAARPQLTDALRDGSQQMTVGGRKRRMRAALVVAETATAVVLLAGAVLMARSLWKLQQVDLGFDPRGVLTMRLALPAAQYETPEQVTGFYHRVLAEARAIPGVERAGLIRLLPLAAPIGDWGLTIENYQPPPGVNTPGDWQIATADGLEALGERVVRGRGLREDDTAGREDVALINEAMAAKYWAGQDALGKRFRMGGPNRPWITVVGIVANVRHNGITSEIKPKFYRAFDQWHLSSGGPARNMTLVVRTGGDNPIALAGAVRARIRRLDASLPIAAVRTMDDVIATSIAAPRLTGRVLSVFGALALILAAIGIYGVLSYVVSQRRQELGIRLAIGAGRRRVLGMVLASGLSLAVIGLVAGLGVAALVLPALSTLLYGVDPIDRMTFMITPAVLLVVAVAAASIPAWRASRIDPIRAIRE
jgi:putative ABC transport system permease protein